jgi:hypothetical protein
MSLVPFLTFIHHQSQEGKIQKEEARRQKEEQEEVRC